MLFITIFQRWGIHNMTQKLLLLNGPNLNMLGTREVDIYGTYTLKEIENIVRKTAEGKGFRVECFQSNLEGELIDKIHEAKAKFDGIVFNPAAYSHTSIAIHDAIKSTGVPVVEIHISNIFNRESFRHQSITAKACIGQITGLGVYGYKLATLAIINEITRKDDLIV